MGDVVVQADGVAKRYRIGEDYQTYRTLRDAVGGLFSRRDARPRRAEIWALDDVSFEVSRGEVLGIVGPNGSGKTTLLKLVSRITAPTRGVVRTRGRAGAILEIGTGFHPELTGAENILLNAAVLGMPRREARRKFGDIVDFAGVGPFIETPLKRYSSGMRMRLAFAIASQVEPPILAVDEVLAVGDAEFQRRCLDKMSELGGAGRTVLFVSHDHGAITRLCTRAIWLDRGHIRAEGNPAEVVRDYLHSIASKGGAVELDIDPGSPAGVRSVALVSANGDPSTTFGRDQPLELRLDLEAFRFVPGLDVAVQIFASDGIRVIHEAWLDESRPPLPEGKTLLTFRMPALLAPGRYVVGVRVGDAAGNHQAREALSFEVLPLPADPVDGRLRITQPPVSWSATPL